MSNYLALAVVIAVASAFWWVPLLFVWRRCRCGTQYCTGCNRPR